MVQIQPRKYVLLNAITGTSISISAAIEMAGGLSLMIFASGVSSGSASFYVDVSNDASLGWVPYNRLITNVPNTNAQNDIRTNIIQQATAGTAIVFFPISDKFNFLRVRADVFATGTYSAILYTN